MNWQAFHAALDDDAPPDGLPRALQALWHDAHGKWDAAHRLVQEDAGPAGAWVHAYLHRKEGDLGNADYWYRRAGRIRPGHSLDEEWEAIARSLLNNTTP